LALERLGESGSQMLPVVHRADASLIIGVLMLDDILIAYGVRIR
jgi:hypothetical protein